jgi:hypothetical protein
MISRREVVTAGVLGTLATAGKAEAAEVQQDVQTLKEGFKALEDTIKGLQNSIDQGLRGNSMDFGSVGTVKDKIEKYAKTSGKFPEYCEVGLSVYHDVYDWHVKHAQPIRITRVLQDQMSIGFMFTTLVLRYDLDASHIGLPFDRV